MKLMKFQMYTNRRLWYRMIDYGRKFRNCGTTNYASAYTSGRGSLSLLRQLLQWPIAKQEHWRNQISIMISQLEAVKIAPSYAVKREGLRRFLSRRSYISKILIIIKRKERK
jgi:hypothetical protein